MKNSELLKIDPNKLHSLDRQRFLSVWRNSQKHPCPHCGYEQSYIEALRIDIDDYDPSQIYGDNVICVACDKPLRYTVPLFAQSASGWCWTTIPDPTLRKRDPSQG